MALIPSDGVDFLLKVNTGTKETPVWTVIGGQRGATLSLTAEQIDASNKQSGAWKTSVPGMMSWSIDADAVREIIRSEIGSLKPLQIIVDGIHAPEVKAEHRHPMFEKCLKLAASKRCASPS